MSHAEESPWEKRARKEAQWRSEGLSIIPHEISYFLPFTYNTSPHSSSRNNEQYKEAKFQFSVKVLLLNNLLLSNSNIYFGYTQLAMWQVYDRNKSAPFRDVNYQPEVFWRLDMKREVGSYTWRETNVGFVHESNGVSDPDSRSWNRVYAKLQFDHERLAFAVKPWVRIPEPHVQDDNPHIERYMGYGELNLSYLWHNHVLSLLLRNNLRANHNKGAIRADYSFPLTRNLTGLIQYFNGYGESLLDYNRPNNRLSFGIALSDWY